ncbi:MAG: hypothetical protein KAS73_04860 [Candidatus Sabulitectum sp.]|nr:hypothetical protein [Candidatus Sabulitectum sp.]
MILPSGMLKAAGTLIVLLPLLLFRSPANSIRSGNDLSAISWILAEQRGEGSWDIYPITITVDIGEMVTFVTIENCGRTTLPNRRLPDEIPFPLDYTETDGTVSIIFSEVP